MQSVHLVSDTDEKELPPVVDTNRPSLWRGLGYLAAGAVLVAVIGTWLVWFSVSLQRKVQDEEVRGACQRLMPETVDRCVDTVVIQRGVVRR